MVLGIRFLHILSAAIFFGGLVPYHFLYPVALRQSDRAVRLGALRVVALVSRVFLSPGSILLLLSGFALSGVLHVSMRQVWLETAVAIYLVASIASMVVLPRHTRALLRAAEEAARNPSAPDPVPTLAAERVPAAVRAVLFYAGMIVLGLMVLHPRP